MPLNRTVSEFTSRRKITYGGSNATENRESLSSKSLQQEAAISPHKANYSFLDNGDEVYIIEFKIGDFRFDEINIRTEGKFFKLQDIISLYLSLFVFF